MATGTGPGQESVQPQEATTTATSASTPATLPATVAGPSGEAPHQQQAEDASPSPPSVERFTPEEATPTQQIPAAQPFDAATASLDEMEAELRRLQELERRQQIREQILAVRTRLERSTTQQSGVAQVVQPGAAASAAQGAPGQAAQGASSQAAEGPLGQVAHRAQLAAYGAQLVAQDARNQTAAAYGAAGLGAATTAATASIPAVGVAPVVTSAAAWGPGVQTSFGVGSDPFLALYPPAAPGTGPGVQSSLGEGAPNLGQYPPAAYAPYPYPFPFAPPTRIPVRQPPKFEGRNAMEWTTWKRACEDEFRNNAAFFRDEDSKVNWSLTHLDSGPRDTVEKYLDARQSRAITWEQLCHLLLNHIGPAETREVAARREFVNYRQADRSFREYTEHSRHLVAQLPSSFPEQERALTYIQNLNPALRALLAHHKMPNTYQAATDLARGIESNMSLLQVGSAYQATGPAHGSRQRSLSPMKREASPPLRDNEDSRARRQRKQKHKERARQPLEDRIQPCVPVPAPTPAPPRQLAPPMQQQTAPRTLRRDGGPLSRLPRKEDGAIDWDKVQCIRCKKYGHTQKFCPQQQGGTLMAASTKAEKDSAQQG